MKVSFKKEKEEESLNIVNFQYFLLELSNSYYLKY